MIHVLNGFTKRLPWPPFRQIGATCLLVETNLGYLLVDTGLGRHDHEKPTHMMRAFMTVMQAGRDPSLALINQVTRLGCAPSSIRHIILTHLHLDHAGGLPDFPEAEVHIHRREYEAWKHPRKLLERSYNQADFAHGPKWRLHEPNGRRWFDLEAMRLEGMIPETWLIPLAGHTSGHCGVAIRLENGWLLHCGDAVPRDLNFHALPMLFYRPTIGAQAGRLKTFARRHPEVHLLPGHMQIDRFRDGANP